MSTALAQLITELEEVTAQMLATSCEEEPDQFCELLARRHRLSAQLPGRQDLDADAAGRIHAVIQSGNDLAARIVAMRDSTLEAMAQTEGQLRFTREFGGTLRGRTPAHAVDIKV